MTWHWSTNYTFNKPLSWTYCEEKWMFKVFEFHLVLIVNISSRTNLWGWCSIPNLLTSATLYFLFCSKSQVENCKKLFILKWCLLACKLLKTCTSGYFIYAVNNYNPENKHRFSWIISDIICLTCSIKVKCDISLLSNKHQISLIL